MKNKRSVIAILMAVIAACMLFAGCGNKEKGALTQTSPAEEKTADAADEKPETSAVVPAPPYFVQGVYANYSEELEDPNKTYFYVFTGDTYGYTADGEANGIGLPFDMEQSDGHVTLNFGAEDEVEDVLIITAKDDNGTVHAYFEDDPKRPLVFELMEGEDPATFSAENYVNGPESSVYHDANGWSVKYDANLFDITPKGPEVFIVYKGESAGTNMITVRYTVEDKGEAAIKKLGESWGGEVSYSEGPFPGAEDVTGYWAVLPPAEDGSGMYMTAIGRDYMDGAIIFELTGHNGNDEEMNMAVSDHMASVIDSLTWDTSD